MKTRKMSLSNKIVIVMLLLIIVSDVLLSGMAYLRSRESLREQIDAQALNIANCMAASIDGDIFDLITEGSEDSEEFQAVMEKLEIFRDYGGVEYAYTVRSTGQGAEFVVDSDPEEPADIGEEFGDDSAELKQALSGKSVVTADPYTDEWGTHLSAYAPFYNSSGQVSGLAVVDISMTTVEDSLKTLLVNVVIMSVVIAVVGIILLFIIRNALNKGFVTLNTEVEALTQGDGDLTRTVNMNSGDEFEVIAGNMNTFIEQIRDIVEGVKKNVSGSVSASDELAYAASTASSTMGELSDVIDDMADGASRQASDINNATGNIEDIVERLGKMDDTVVKANEFTDNMNRNSTTVSENFDVLIKAIQNSMENLRSVTNEMTTVAGSVNEVKDAANAINAIASQTNLLSLNASIEAARAGEAGRGFAVVAEEIGLLADQSNDSSASINRIMDELDKETKEAIRLVDQLNSVMAEQEKTSLVSKESLGLLFEDIGNTRETFGLIKESVAQIQDACTSLDSSIQSLASISDANAASASQTASSIAEIRDVTKTVSEMADNIKSLSGNLGNMVDRYKV
ncbi:MAG: hypothetical protein IKY04_03660 [Lachnospiraceae bacterium]|nr:hypothetical protein [Lachnospiraceae bacterium]MBR4993325.1 hypothetical protein [Lachnospiraceae bacterium]